MASERFEWCVERVVNLEGGLTDDPDDPGGLTKFGISQRQYPLLDIANLTREEAIAIYRRDYWDACHAATLPWPLDYYVFDSAVNQGVTRAIRLLQLAVRVSPDGIIGPVTLRAIKNANVGELAAHFMTQRAMHYISLGTFWKFGEGWFNRLFLVAGDH